MDKNKKPILKILFVYNSLSYVAGATFGPYISVYYKINGLSIFQIGLLSEVGALVALFIQPLWGRMADKMNKRVQLLKAAIAGAAVLVLSYGFADSFYSFLTCVFFFSVFSSAISPLGDTVVTDLAEKNHLRYAVIRMGGTISYAVVVIFAGIFIKKNPSISFPITSCMYLLMLAVVFMMPDAYKAVNKERKKEDYQLLKVFKNKQILFILAYCCIFQIVIGCYSSYLSLLVVEMGYDSKVIGLLMFISASSEIPVLLNIEKFLKRFGSEKVMLFAGFMMVIRILLPTMGTLTGVILGQLLQGMTYMIMYYSTVMYMVHNVSEELHGTAQSLLCLVQAGIASLFSNVAGGYLCDRLGIIKTYQLYGGILLSILIVFVLFFYFCQRSGKHQAF